MSAESTRHFRLVVAYDGGRYHGWQAQAQVPTVEGELGRALEALTGERPHLFAAGRTDAGAHAHGQVVAFSLRREWSPPALLRGCNDLLPEDVALISAELTDQRFRPRQDAWRRTYRYLIRDAAGPDPVGRQYEWRLAFPLELSPMREAARALRGTHDFRAFGSSPRPGGSTVRTVERAELSRNHRLIVLEVRADAFLRGMMRALAGALVAVGRGRAGAADLARAISEPFQARSAWELAPAHGLHQWRVDYHEAGRASP